jgi:tail lysozyme
MSLLNGLSLLGQGMTAFGTAAAKDLEETRLEAARASLLNSASAAAAPASVAAPTATTNGDPSLPGPRNPTSGRTNLPGSPLDPATIARAHDVYQGLLERGMDPDTALGFTANAVQESSANPGVRPGDAGAAHGLLQWRDDRLANYVAKFGHPPEQGGLAEQLDFIMHEISGPESGAWRKIQSAPAGPGPRAAAISAAYERPKDTDAEMARRSGIADQLAGHFAKLAASTGGV